MSQLKPNKMLFMSLRDSIARSKNKLMKRLRIDSRSTSPAPPGPDTQASGSTSTSENPHEKRHMASPGAKTLPQVLESSLDAFGPLKSAISGLNKCMDIFERAAKGHKDYEELRTKLDGLLAELTQHMNKLEDAVMADTVKLLCAEIEEELARVKEKQARSLGQRLAEVMDTQGAILECYRRIQGHLERLTLNVNMRTLKVVTEPTTELRLKGMFPSSAALYHSAESADIRRGGCAPGTREHQIDLILKWARDPDTGPTCWMTGMAGTGKTTIAYTVCSTLESRSALGASFFCSRTIPECRQVKRIIPTIAYQLARYSLPFRCELDKVLQTDPNAHTRALKIQYQKLIVEPLLQVRTSLPTDFIVVIDALDECENVNGLDEILSLILSAAGTIPIRFLVSSGLEPEITRRLTGQVAEQDNILLVLYDIDADRVKPDIAVFMKQELQGIPLTKKQLSKLIARCGALFICASTTCRFIRNEHNSGFLNAAVNAVIGSSSTHAERGNESGIDWLYVTILKAALGDKSKMLQGPKKRMRDILETVICAGEPMELEALAGLLNFESVKQVNELLQPLRSVLNIVGDNGSQFVTTLHASFPYFMFSDERSGEFHCNGKSRNLWLAKGCLAIIEAVKPTFNICGLSSSYLSDDKVEDIGDKVKRAVSPGLAYASRYWSIHLLLGEYKHQLADIFHKFLSSRLLIWLEILNLTKRMRFGLSIIQHAERWCIKWQVAEDIVKLARDAGQFVSAYANHPVSQSTPHIYVSMLPFWPASRPVSTTYNPRTAGMLEPKGTAIDRRQPALMATWKVSSGPVSSICLSTDGAEIVAAADDAIDILDTSTGEGILHVQQPQTKEVCTVAMSPAGSRIAFGSPSGAYILDVKTCKITQLCPEQIDKVRVVIFSTDGSRIAIGSENGNAYIWGTQQAELALGPLEGHTDKVISLAFSSDCQHLASGSSDKTIRIWDTRSGQIVGNALDSHSNWVWSVSYSPDDARLASASTDGTIRVWDPQTGKTILGPLESHSDAVYAVTFSSNGTLIASGWRDGTIRVYDAHTAQTILGPLQRHTRYVESTIFSPDGAQLFSCSGNGTIRLWNVQDRHVPIASHPDVPIELLSVRYSPDGLQVVSGSYDGTVHVWNVQTGEIVLGPLKGHTSPVYAVDYSPNGAYIASASEDSTLRIWSAQDGKDMHGSIQGHTDWVNCARFSPDSSLVVSGSNDRTVRVWDVATGQPVAEPLRGHSHWVQSVAFSPNGSHVVSGSNDRTIRVWDTRTGQPVIGPLQGHEYPVCSVEFSRDGTRILSGSWDKSIRTWDAVTGQPLLVFGKHRGCVLSAAFSPDGRLIVSGSYDRTVCVWDGQSGDLILALEGHKRWVGGVQFSPDGSHVVSCSNDGTMRFWDVSTCRARVGDKSTKDDVEEDHATRVDATSQPWTLRDDGWVVDGQGQRLVWVPSDLQRSVLLPYNDCMISNAAQLALNFDKVNVAKEWTKCYQP